MSNTVNDDAFTTSETPKILQGLWQQALVRTRRRFFSSLDGIKEAHSLAKITDSIILLAYNRARKHRADCGKISIVAIGGYGMAMQAPYSDMDILFLCEHVEECKNCINQVLYALWDTGARVSQTIHTIKTFSRAIKSDTIFLTSVMTARLLDGDKNLFGASRKTLKNYLSPYNAYDFAKKKWQECKNRHLRFGDSSHTLEPNVKDGKGVIRDLQTLLWVGSCLYHIGNDCTFFDRKIFTQGEQRSFEAAYAFLWTVRFALHAMGYRDNILHLDTQKRIANMVMSKAHVEIFMKKYFSTIRIVGSLMRAFMAFFENRHSDASANLPFLTKGDSLPPDKKIHLKNKNPFIEDPSKILEVFLMMDKKGYREHPYLLTTIERSIPYINEKFRQDSKTNHLFIRILTHTHHPEKILRSMNEIGFLEVFIPQWKRIVCQMQYDMYHSFTTDEHTLHAIGWLSKIARGSLKKQHPLCTKILSEMTDKRMIYVSTLLHDIGKGLGGNHAIMSAKISQQLCPRFGFKETETQTITWLIKEHLTLSLVAQRRDLNDPKTIADFAKKVKSISSLNMLTVLTVIDMLAVGPNVYNAWKEKLIHDIYDATHAALSGVDTHTAVRQKVTTSKRNIERSLQGMVDDSRLQNFLQCLPLRYILGTSQASLVWQARQILHSKRCVKALESNIADSTKLFIYLPDQESLIALLSGVMAILNINITEAQIYKIASFGVIAILYVKDYNKKFSKRLSDKILKTIEEVLNNTITIQCAIAKTRCPLRDKKDAFTIAGRVLIDNDCSYTNSLIEVETKDRKGLLFDLTKTLTDLKLKIYTAKICTYGERVVDIFYIRDKFGLKLSQREKQNAVRKALLHTLKMPTQ